MKRTPSRAFAVDPGRATSHPDHGGSGVASGRRRTPRRALVPTRSKHRSTLAWLLAVVMVFAGLILPSVTASSVAPPPLPEDSKDQTFAAGSYIIDSGFGGTAITQPKPEGLQPYGLIYQLLVTEKIPVYWIIANGKTGTVANAPNLTNTTADLTGVSVYSPYTQTTAIKKSYYSGPFVIPAEYMTNTKLAAIITAAGLTSVRVDRAAQPFTAPVYDKVTYWPKAVLNNENQAIAKGFYASAKIPETTRAYSFKLPSELNACDDIFVMPHADPTWATHNNLIPFNDRGGYIWAGCHAASVLENIDSPDAGSEPNMNFLTTEGLLDWGDHGGGSTPYYYGENLDIKPWTSLTAPGTGTIGTTPADRSDPVMQFIGATELAHQNGSEQIYMPNPETLYPSLTGVSRWNPGVRFISWDPTQADVIAKKSPGVAAADVYGRGFDGLGTNPIPNGLVMYEGGHNINGGSTGDTPALRAFFNFLLLGGIERAPEVEINRSTLPATYQAGGTVPLTATIPTTKGSSPFTYKWESVCDGPNQGSFTTTTGTTAGGTVSTTWNVPAVDTPTACQFRIVVTDACDRQVFDSVGLTVMPVADLKITKTSSAAAVSTGSNVTYTLTVTNLGPASSGGVVVTDTLPASLSYVSASPSPASVSGQVVTWNLGTLASGASTTLTVTAKANTGGITVQNKATVSATTPDPNMSNNTAYANTQVINSGISITKVARPEIVPSTTGGPVTYEFVVRNVGDNPVSNVVVTDNPGCTISGPTGDLNGDSKLDPPYLGVDREIWRYTCTRTVDINTGDIGPSGPNPDGKTSTKDDVVTVTGQDAANNLLTATATTRVTISTPAISVTKTLEPTGQTPATGQTATFRVVVSNTGNVPLTEVDTQDAWTPGSCDSAVIPNLGVGQRFSMVCTTTLPATGNTNTVTATAKDPFGGAVGPASASATLTRGTPSLSITKTATTAGPVKNGDSFNYTVTVTNSGTQTQTGLVVSDTLPTGLSSNGGVTVTKTGYTVNASDGFGTGTVVKETSYALGPGWAGNWTETVGDTNSDPTGGKIRVATVGNPANSLAFTPDKNRYTIKRGVTLTGATSGTLSFDCRAGAALVNDTDAVKNDALDVLVNGSSVFTINSTNYSTLCSTATSPWSLPVSITLTAAQLGSTVDPNFISFSATGDVDLWVDNVTLSATVPAVPSTPAGATPNLHLAPTTLGFYNLAPGQSATFTIPVTVTGAPFDGFQFSNVAQATSTLQLSPVAASVITPYKQTASFDITKTAVETWVNLANRTVTYRFEIHNTGNTELTYVSVSDPLCTGALSARSGDLNSDDKLQVREIWQYSCTRTFTDAELTAQDTNPNEPDNAPNTVTAVFTATGFGNVTNSATANVKVLHPSITLTVDPMAKTVLTGGTVAYTYTVDNTGDVAITNPAVTAANCSPVVYGSGDSDNDGILDIDETWTFTCTTGALASDQTNQLVTATGNALIFATPLTATKNVNVTVINPKLAVVKTASASGVTTGDSITVGYPNSVTYLYAVTNTGNVALTSVTGLDNKCSPVTRTTGDASLDPNETWQFSCGPVGLEVDTTNSVQFDGAYSVGGVTGSVAATDTAHVAVMKPGLMLTKSASASRARVGGQVVYTYVITNTGATQFARSGFGASVVGDDKCSSVTFKDWIVNRAPLDMLDPPIAPDPNNPADPGTPGDQIRYTCTATMAAGDVVDDRVVNTATMGSVTDTRGSAYTPTPATASVFILNPDFKVEKKATTSLGGPEQFVDGEVGLPVAYTFKIQHSITTPAGNFMDGLNALAVKVEDNKCSTPVPALDANANGVIDGDTNSNGSLDPGEVWSPDGDTNRNGIVDPDEVWVRLLFGDSDANGLLNPGETFIYGCALSALPDGDPTVNTVSVTGTVAERTMNGTDPAEPLDGLGPFTKTATATVTPIGKPVTVHKQGLNCDVGVPVCDSLPGSSFSVYASDPTVPGATGVPLTNDPAGTPTFVTGKLTVHHDYWLVETKAPDGFQLLPQPIKFNVGMTGITLDAASASSLITANAFTITVTDVPAAELPKVGGDGPWPFLGGGLALLLAAGVYLLKTSGPQPAPRRVAP